MASLNYNRQTQLGAMTGSLINGIIQMKFLATRLKEILDANSEKDYTKVETLFGLDVGTGQDFHQTISLIADVLTKIDSLAKLDQG